MHIEFERSGGFMGLRSVASVDTEALPAEDARLLEQGIKAANFFSLPAVLPSPGRGADRYTYRLSVQDGQRNHNVEFGEAATPAELKPVVEKLENLARPGGRP